MLPIAIWWVLQLQTYRSQAENFGMCCLFLSFSWHRLLFPITRLQPAGLGTFCYNTRWTGSNYRDTIQGYSLMMFMVLCFYQYCIQQARAFFIIITIFLSLNSDTVSYFSHIIKCSIFQDISVILRVWRCVVHYSSFS